MTDAKKTCKRCGGEFDDDGRCRVCHPAMSRERCLWCEGKGAVDDAPCAACSGTGWVEA